MVKDMHIQNITERQRMRYLAVFLITAIACTCTVAAQAILTTPGAGERFVTGDSIVITWSGSDGQESATLELWDGMQGEWHTIAAGIPLSSGIYTWPLDSSLTGERFRIRMTVSSNDHARALSNGYFAVDQEENLPLERRAAPAAFRTQPSTSYALVMSPNPASTVITINAVDGTFSRVRCFDAHGTVAGPSAVLSGNSTCATLDVRNWPSGTYFVEAEMSDGRIIGRMCIVAR